MASPIELTFGARESLGTINSITMGPGISYGTVSMPFTPIVFDRAHMEAAFGRGYATAMQLPVNNERYYWDHYVPLPGNMQRHFHGPIQSVTRQVIGLALGVNESGMLSAAGDTVGAAIRSGTRAATWMATRAAGIGRLTQRALFTQMATRAVSAFLNRVGLDAAQTSATFNALLYGMNSNNGYNMAMSSFVSNPALNIFILGGNASAFVQASGSIAFIGPFRSIRSLFDGPPEGWIFELIGYLHDVASRSYAYVFLREAAAGLILPGAQIGFVAS